MKQILICLKKFLKLFESKDFLWNSIGIFSNTVISLLALIVVTRVNGIETAGLFSYSFSIALIMFTIGMYGGRLYQVSDIKGENTPGEYISFKLLTSFFMILIAFLFSYFNNYDLTKTSLIIILTGYRACESLSDTLHGIMQQRKKLYMAGIFLTIKGFCGMVAFLIIDLVTKNILLASFGIFAIYFFMLSIDFIYIQKIKPVKIKFSKNLFQLFYKCRYVFAFSIFTALILNIQKYFVDLFETNTVQGYFSILVMPATLVYLFVQALFQPWVVSLTKEYNNKNYKSYYEKTSKILKYCIVFGILLLVLMFAFGPLLLKILYGIDFRNYRLLIGIVILSGMFQGITTMLTSFLIIARCQKPQLINYFKVILFSLIISIILIKSNGLNGAIYSYLLMMGFQLILFSNLFNKQKKKLIK